ncbi:MAG: S41 family peptidase [Anaerolineae bacterium]|jgi:carboxyl-terminal processing protease
MSDSTGCKLFLTALIVAVVMGSLGFATGFLTHTVLVAAKPTTPQTTVIQVTATPQPPTEPSSAPTVESTVEPPPTPVPEIDIPPERGTTFDLFWEAWELIERDFFGDLPTEEELTYGAIRGMIDTLDDPFTGFIDPDVAAINREDDSGTFEGIGAYVTMEEGRLKIVSTFKDQPADEAGLRAGDIVLQADDTQIEDMSIYEAITLIRGPAGTMVRLTILREGQEPFEVEITRARIEIPVVESEMREDGIAYVSLFDFSSDASAKLEDAVEELLAQDPQGLILDLRGNPGGWLNEAILVSGLFLPEGELVLTERYKDADPRTHRTPNEPIALDIPMVLLVNGGSASASEIVAGALQDHGRAILIGEQTFGKGSVQWPHELSNGAELRVTVARWFTPNDRAIHGEGLEPDIIVELTPEDVEADLDPQLERAVEYLLTGE